MSWLSAVPVIAAAALVILVPGLIASAPLRLGLVGRAAVAASAGVASIAGAGIVFSLLGVPFAAWQPLVIGIVLALCAAVYRRRTPRATPAREGVPRWSLVLAWLCAAAVIAVVAFALVPSPERISQTYDNVFHLSATARILADGDASSLTLRTLIETDKTFAFYPAAWHALVAATVQVSGAGIPIAANAAWIAVAAVVWLPGVAWLAQVLVSGFASGRVALVALPLGAAFAAMPYGLLTWGTLYPSYLATALLPVAIAAPLAALVPRGRTRLNATYLALWPAAGITVVAVAAVGFSQPRVLVTWAVILAPFAISRAAAAYVRARRAGGPSRRVAGRWASAVAVTTVLGAIAGFAYLVLRLDLFGRPLEDRLGGPQAMATQSVLDGLVQVALQSWPTGVGGQIVFPAVLLAAAVALGLVLASRRRGMRWAVAAYALLAVLFALAAGADDVFAKLATALWYKDRYRLSSALPVLGVAFATLAILWTSRRLARRSTARRLPIAVALVTAVVATSAIAMAWGGVSRSVAAIFRLPDAHARTAVVSQAQIDFMRTAVAQTVPADQRLLGDPWDGSALSQLYAGREPVFPHVNGQWDPERLVLAWQLERIDDDPAVCQALDALRVRYVLYHPHEFGGGDPSGNHFAAVHRAVEEGLFEPVATDGDSVLYRIGQCGPLS
ncbi:hypothetical protein QE374_000982 [Microbacterium sp. SORGH_AS428]|uniref:DUF6541 family protein n=1 Tax=Microbacterium sp. SORGH_AS_0428 TaxID=3041788 RepID=UPI002867531F|nr:DUF6541 family protein [Microbacterium sp. SORGH_AS_0428]MDR6199073.1 hypothetical protein [Microbacterium sp. SORGH_AS_0428]